MRPNEDMKPMPVLDVPEKLSLKAERVQEELERLPDWTLRPDGKGIERIRPFAEPSKARSFVNHVCRMSSLRRQPVTIAVDAKGVVVTLMGHPVRGCTGGLTGAVLDLAALIG
jgi:pterin-4a-carbinolamine dehydratase